MASSCVYDLHKTSDFDEIVIADFDEGLANRVIGLMPIRPSRNPSV